MRLIDADKLQEEFKELHGGKRSLLIDIAPTADVVEIVRCKDCKHYVLHTLFGRTQGWCERLCDEFDKSLAHGTEEDDYCSHGEREIKNE